MAARSVLVTGASTGIGFGIAEDLAKRGYRVFGSVRREEDGGLLRERGITPLVFDVTDEAAVSDAAATLERELGEAGLGALINNAGIVGSGPLELVPTGRLREVFEVNVFGVHTVTRALLPLLRRAKGRVVNMSSVSGLVAMPFLGPYAGSKFALEALSDSLRRELAEHGVAVSVVEPGPIKTPIWDKAFEASVDPRGSVYEASSLAFSSSVERSAAGALPVERVTEAVARLLLAPRPKTRVIVQRGGGLMVRLVRLLPDRLADRMVAARLRRAKTERPR